MSQYKQNALIFKAFCNDRRLRIVDLIRIADEICACVLLKDLSISQSTLSHHMKILVDSGLVSSRREGKRTYYSLSKGMIEKSIDILNSMLIINQDERNQNLNSLFCEYKQGDIDAKWE